MVGRWCTLTGSHLLLSLRIWVCHPDTRIYVRLLGPCFKTGRLKPFRQDPWAACASRPVASRTINTPKSLDSTTSQRPGRQPCGAARVPQSQRRFQQAFRSRPKPAATYLTPKGPAIFPPPRLILTRVPAKTRRSFRQTACSPLR
jgi:hypothetical protein